MHGPPTLQHGHVGDVIGIHGQVVLGLQTQKTKKCTHKKQGQEIKAVTGSELHVLKCYFYGSEYLRCHQYGRIRVCNVDRSKPLQRVKEITTQHLIILNRSFAHQKV